eukprot:510448_1
MERTHKQCITLNHERIRSINDAANIFKEVRVLNRNYTQMTSVIYIDKVHTLTHKYIETSAYIEAKLCSKEKDATMLIYSNRRACIKAQINIFKPRTCIDTQIDLKAAQTQRAVHSKEAELIGASLFEQRHV